MAVFIREISIAGKIVVILKQAPSHGSPGGPTHLSVTGTNIQRSPILTRNRISKVGTFPLLWDGGAADGLAPVWPPTSPWKVSVLLVDWEVRPRPILVNVTCFLVDSFLGWLRLLDEKILEFSSCRCLVSLVNASLELSLSRATSISSTCENPRVPSAEVMSGSSGDNSLLLFLWWSVESLSSTPRSPLLLRLFLWWLVLSSSTCSRLPVCLCEDGISFLAFLIPEVVNTELYVGRLRLFATPRSSSSQSSWSPTYEVSITRADLDPLDFLTGWKDWPGFTVVPWPEGGKITLTHWSLEGFMEI